MIPGSSIRSATSMTTTLMAGNRSTTPRSSSTTACSPSWARISWSTNPKTTRSGSQAGGGLPRKPVAEPTAPGGEADGAGLDLDDPLVGQVEQEAAQPMAVHALLRGQDLDRGGDRLLDQAVVEAAGEEEVEGGGQEVLADRPDALDQ